MSIFQLVNKDPSRCVDDIRYKQVVSEQIRENSD